MTALTERADFLDFITRPDAAIDLAGAALLLARDEYPDLDVAAYHERLAIMVAKARSRTAGAGDNPFAVIDALNEYLFGEEGFSGNHAEYFDPRNSYLNDVLDRKRGIPISLSVIYIEIASGVGFPVEGVGFPGHFLVRHSGGGRDILIDPFHAGEILLPEDCRKRLSAAYGDDMRLEPRFFETAGKLAILARMLHNLKHLYMKSQDHARALRVIDRLIAISPRDPQHLRDRGQANAGLGRYASASADLQRYLAQCPEADDRTAVEKQIKSLRRLSALLN